MLGKGKILIVKHLLTMIHGKTDSMVYKPRIWVLGLLISLALAASMGAAAGCNSGSGSTALQECAAGCPDSWINNGQCDSACNNAACNYDGGDCDLTECPSGYSISVNNPDKCCSNGLPYYWAADNMCRAISPYAAPTSTQTMHYCAPGCPDSGIGDGVCDNSCNVAACGYDGGDCAITECNAGYSIAVNNDGICCPNGYPYYWSADGKCHTTSGQAPTPTPGCPTGSSQAVNNPGKCCPSGYPYYWSSDDKCHTASGPVSTPAPVCPAGYPYYWTSDNKCHTAAQPAWMANLRSGDILLDPNGAWTLGHVGICYGTDYVIEAKESGVTKTPISDWDDKPGLYVLRVACSDAVADQAADLALTQLGKSYRIYIADKSDSMNSETWYCSELVWAVYRNLGIELEYTPDNGAVTPWEVYMSTQVIYHDGPPDIIPDSND